MRDVPSFSKNVFECIVICEYWNCLLRVARWISVFSPFPFLSSFNDYFLHLYNSFTDLSNWFNVLFDLHEGIQSAFVQSLFLVLLQPVSRRCFELGSWYRRHVYHHTTSIGTHQGSCLEAEKHNKTTPSNILLTVETVNCTLS